MRPSFETEEYGLITLAALWQGVEIRVDRIRGKVVMMGGCGSVSGGGGDDDGGQARW